MKVVWYFDVYPWSNETTNPPFPSLSPGEKAGGSVRYKVETEVPDPRKPDHEIHPKAVEVEN